MIPSLRFSERLNLNALTAKAGKIESLTGQKAHFDSLTIGGTKQQPAVRITGGNDGQTGTIILALLT